MYPPWAPFTNMRKHNNITTFYTFSMSNNNILKNIILYYIMETDKSVKLSKEEKGDIFEVVNSLYLNFKGQNKKSFKQNFKSVWKENNNLFKLVMTLYNAEDIIEGRKNKLEDEINGGWIPEDWEIKKVSWKKYRGMCIHLGEEVKDLEEELEKIKEGSGYISEAEHKAMMQNQHRDSQYKIDELDNEIRKYKNESDMLREKVDFANKRLEAQKLYYEDQMKKLSMD